MFYSLNPLHGCYSVVSPWPLFVSPKIFGFYREVYSSVLGFYREASCSCGVLGFYPEAFFGVLGFYYREVFRCFFFYTYINEKEIIKKKTKINS